MNATRAAAEEGIVPGGGTALLRCAKLLDGLEASGDVLAGIQIVRKALFEPATNIVANTGINPAVIIEKVSIITKSRHFIA